MELARNGKLADLLETGAIVKTAFCGPCFGAGDTPANNAFSIRHSTRNFPNREGSKIQNGQISSVALMDARSIAATAANKGFLTAADEFTGTYTKPAYHFDKKIYENRVFDSKGVADPSVEIQFGPNIKDWPAMPQLAENLILKVVSESHDPVTTTDELIPSGETSSFRSNPLGLAEFTLSRKDPAYVGRAKEVQVAEKAIQEGNCPAEALPELKPVFAAIHTQYPDIDKTNVGVGSTIFLPEGIRRLGKHRQRVCNEALPLQPDQLGHASIPDPGERSAVYKRRLHLCTGDPQGSGRESRCDQSVRCKRRSTCSVRDDVRRADR